MLVYEIGDRVVITINESMNPYLHVGSIGTVVGYYTENITHVAWDEYCDGHTCGNRAPHGHGWNVHNRSIEHCEYENTTEAEVDFDHIL